jgi:CRP-like cAMP-binding protein
MGRRQQVVAPQLLRAITSIALYCLLFGWGISVIFHYSITGWLAGTTVLAAVLGLALQETLGNLFSGIALHLEDTFAIGDIVHSGEFMGVVESVSWRSTKVRTFDNNVVVLPNSILGRERLEIFPRNNLNARILKVGVDYHVPPAQVIAVLTQAASHVEGVSRERPCFARVGAFADSSVVYEIKYFTREYAARDRIDAEIRKAVWYALQRNDISIAFPIRAYQPYMPPKAESHDVSREEVLGRLRAVDLLAPLSEMAQSDVAEAANIHFYAKGETILRRGTAGNSMFIIHEGTVSVRVNAGNGAPVQEVARLGPGEVFGEMALLTGEARTADIVALTDTIAFEIAKVALQPILVDHPELAGAITAKIMARRDHAAEQRAEAPDDDEGSSIVSRIRAYFGL